MSLKQRNGIWHFRKQIEVHTLAFSTKTGDEKLAREIATVREAQFLRDLLVGGKRSIKLHDAINAWVKQRVGTAGYANAKRQISLFKTLQNRNIHELSQLQVQAVVNQRRADGMKPSTLSVMVNYWNCLVKWVGDRPREDHVRTSLG
jgi:hypothetical protein